MVDDLSGGRLDFGIGAGWAENEHTMLGVEFGTVKDRAERLEESIEVIPGLWTQPRTTFAGEHYQLWDAVADRSRFNGHTHRSGSAGRGPMGRSG